MSYVIVAVVSVVGGFVFGVLFGRKNVSTVNSTVATVDKTVGVAEKVVADVKAGATK